MKAHVTYTQDGRIVSVALGDGVVLSEDGELGTDVELPDGFPSMAGPDAEREVAAAVARLDVGPGGADA
ncbi:hypothetical protein [Cellulomonas sp. URHB0016]